MDARIITWVFFTIFSTPSSATLMQFYASHFNVEANKNYEDLSLTVDGISVSISAYTINNDGNGTILDLTKVTGQNLGVYVDDKATDGYIGVKSNNKSTNLNGVDDASEPDEGLLFVFDQPVFLDFIDFDFFTSSKNDSFNLTVDDVNQLFDINADQLASNVQSVSGDFGEYTFTGISGTRFLIWGDEEKDNFRIDRIEVTAAPSIVAAATPATVPEPSILLLMGSGLIGLILFRDEKLKVKSST